MEKGLEIKPGGPQPRAVARLAPSAGQAEGATERQEAGRWRRERRGRRRGVGAEMRTTGRRRRGGGAAVSGRRRGSGAAASGKGIEGEGEGERGDRGRGREVGRRGGLWMGAAQY